MSTDHQDYSTINQVESIEKFARARDLSIIRTYADEGRSGLRLKNRLGLQKLLQDVAHGPDFSTILVYDVSRWGRFQDIDESAHYEYLCKNAGVKVLYCVEPFDSNGGVASDIFKTLKRAMAGEFSRDLSEKVSQGHRRLARSGYRQGGPVVYGMRRVLVSSDGKVKGGLVSGEYKALSSDRVMFMPGSEEEKGIINAIFNLYVSGALSPQEIADVLNEKGLQPLPNVLWSRRRIYTVLTNEIYIGNYVYGKATYKLKGPRCPAEPSVWTRSERVCDPIVEPDLFRAAQAIIKDRSSGEARSRVVTGTKGANRLKGPEKLRAMDPLQAPSLEGMRTQLLNGYRFYRLGKGSAGWTVMVTFRGKRFTSYFADSAYGSAELSRAAAEAAGERDRYICLEAASLRSRLTVRSSSRTGVPGVTRVGANETRGAHWIAYWTESIGGKRRFKRFYVEHHGEEGSRRLAMETREAASAKDRLRWAEIIAYFKDNGWVEAV